MLLLAWHSISYHYCIPFWHLRSELESTMLSISILADLSNGGEPATRIPASSSGCWWRNRHKESRMSWGGFFLGSFSQIARSRCYWCRPSFPAVFVCLLGHTLFEAALTVLLRWQSRHVTADSRHQPSQCRGLCCW